MTTPPSPLSRRRFLRGSLLAGSGAALAACSTNPTPAAPTSSLSSPATPSPSASTPPPDSWAPAPVRVGRFSCIARAIDDRLALHTAGGDVTFWTGVTLGTTTPGHLADSRSATRADYRRWLPMMARLGLRIIRVPGLHPAHFYDELHRYNTEHPTSPLYLIHGLELPENDVLAADGLYDPALVRRTQAQVEAVVGAVHGDLTLPASAGQPVSGTFAANVSEWTIAYILGTSWDPGQVQRTDAGHASAPAVTGRYVRSAPRATPAERWCAARLEELATLLAERKESVPLAIAGSPELDPLQHPTQPETPDSQASLDPRRILTTEAWPAGRFAAYDAYPYRPIFLFTEPELAGDDAYSAYLQALRSALAGMPLLLTGFGVTTALGSGYNGVNGRNQGEHTEPQAMQQNADTLRLFASLGIAGATLPAWHDDWSALTWNTAERYASVPAARRVLFHDPLTADQWAGIVAHDAVRVGERTVHDDPRAYLRKVTFDYDASWAYVTLYFAGRVTSPVEIGFDLIDGPGLRFPGGSGPAEFDVAIRMVPTMSTTVVFVRSGLDPIRLDRLPGGWWPSPARGGWNTEQLVLSRGYLVPGSTTPTSPAFLDIGTLALGCWWDEKAADYNTLATWHLARASAQEPAILRFRIPWSMLAFADPAGRQVLLPGTVRASLVPIRAINVTIESSTPGSPITFPLGWAPWKTAPYTERVKSGAPIMAAALAELTTRTAPVMPSPTRAGSTSGSASPSARPSTS